MAIEREHSVAEVIEFDDAITFVVGHHQIRVGPTGDPFAVYLKFGEFGSLSSANGLYDAPRYAALPRFNIRGRLTYAGIPGWLVHPVFESKARYLFVIPTVRREQESIVRDGDGRDLAIHRADSNVRKLFEYCCSLLVEG